MVLLTPFALHLAVLFLCIWILRSVCRSRLHLLSHAYLHMHNLSCSACCVAAQVRQCPQRALLPCEYLQFLAMRFANQISNHLALYPSCTAIFYPHANRGPDLASLFLVLAGTFTVDYIGRSAGSAMILCIPCVPCRTMWMMVLQRSLARKKISSVSSLARDCAPGATNVGFRTAWQSNEMP